MISQTISRGSRSCPEVIKLRILMNEIQKGVEGIGLRRELRPENVIRVSTTLRDGDMESISTLMKDVAGESLGLCAGSSTFGIEAMNAISDAQASCLVSLRERIQPFQGIPSIESGAYTLLHEHQEMMLKWVESGNAEHESNQSQSDLTQIGQRFLHSPALRQCAISVFIASTETMKVSLGLVR